MVTARIYVEGGGIGKPSRTLCRKAFSTFLKKAAIRPGSFRVVACGPRGEAFKSFKLALSQVSGAFPILLVDSETPVTQSPWEHLRKNDKWTRPPAAAEENAHLMIQCMESWFLADCGALEEFFGVGFRSDSLPANPRLETIPKEDVLKSLGVATRDTKKGGHEKAMAFQILPKLDPARVRQTLPSAERFLGVLQNKT